MGEKSDVGGSSPIFEIRQISDVGTRNPIVARLGLQTANLLEWLNVDSSTMKRVRALYLEKLQGGLVNCLKTRDEIVRRATETMAQVEKFPHQGAIAVPYIIDLEKLVGDFLYGANNYLRDLLQVLNILYGEKFTRASAWSDLKDGETRVGRWAKVRFGLEHRMTTLLTWHADPIRQIVYLRHAFEHPDELSGNIEIGNFRRDPENPGQYLRPTWQRVGKDPYGPGDLIEDMDGALRTMLHFGEELIAEAVTDNPVTAHFEVMEIPANERDVSCPIRFRVAPLMPLPK